MQFELIKNAPANLQDYVSVPDNDKREDYVNHLAGLLRGDTHHIRTEPVTQDVAVAAWDLAQPKHYRVMAMSSPVNFGEAGAAFLYFYFERTATHPAG